MRGGWEEGGDHLKGTDCLPDGEIKIITPASDLCVYIAGSQVCLPATQLSDSQLH